MDKALNYKSKTFYKDWKAQGYLDVYFDNVGGVSLSSLILRPHVQHNLHSQDILDFALTKLNKGARVVLCGV